MNSSFDTAVIQGETMPISQAEREFYLQLSIEYALGQKITIPLTPLLSYEEATAAHAFFQIHPINLSTLAIRKLTML
ncbi:hypothetical protein R6242_14225 [Iodobacter sp. CM08]|uniref:hypothetical protein n=1 Tax=Iodobacter sp. CM08 TaxID=3085902 RepID=UPI0029821F7F|nr:hypothetical protein [Iodobacter sp. CM08]MDW5417723.1 hypothetical protein [Iodobacter sp. CM08]